MNTLPKNERLGFFPDFARPNEPDLTVEKVADYMREDFIGVEAHDKPDEYYRERDIHTALEIVALRHFELADISVDEAGWYVEHGFDSALHYFLDPWWEGDERCRKALDKSHPDRRLMWFEAFSRGLILGLLSQRMDDVARLASWAEADLEPEYKGMGGDLEVQVAQIYLLLAAALRTDTMPGVDALRAKLSKCRTKRPRLLLKAWEAVESGEQSNFDKAMEASLTYFWQSPKIPPDHTLIADRLALPQTAICLIAMQRGLDFPQVPEPLGDLLITRQSLGLS